MVNLRAFITNMGMAVAQAPAAWPFVAAIIAVAALPPQARAAAFEVYEMGTPDLGTASAGRAALAKD